jgi:hypothetical protein
MLQYFYKFSGAYPSVMGGIQWRSWLRQYASSWKVAASIFHWHNPSGRTMALGSTQPLTEMSTTNISWGVKAAGTYGWQPYHLYVPTVWKSGSLNVLEPSRPVRGTYRDCFTFTCSNRPTPSHIHVKIFYGCTLQSHSTQ